MEGRLNPGLWLEMTDLPADEYMRERVPDVLALPHAHRASWWRNARPDRDDLPRVLPEFGLLGLYEVGTEFRPPPELPGVTGLCFVRTPRPGQGNLSGRPTTGLSLVLISPREPHQAQALRDWGDFVHIREIAATGVPGMRMITPYQNAAGEDPRYLHLYETDAENPDEVFTAMTPLVTERVGARDSVAWRHWATCPELRIMYVNTFERLGSLRSDELSVDTARVQSP